jgi:hypothetical protein
MHTFLKRLLLFFAFAITAYVLLLIFWGEVMPNIFKKNLNYSLGAYGHMHTRLNEIEKHKAVDILFIGSSHAYRGFDTRIAKEYGYESFNLGSSAQTPVQTKLLLEKYLDKIKPATVIYEVYPYTFINDGVESSLDIIANGTIDGNTIKMAFELNHIKTYNSLVYGFYRHLLNRDKNFKENTVIKEDTYIPGGFVERKIANNTDGISSVVDKKAEWVPKPYQLAAFEQIITLLKQKGIKLILIQAPVTKQEKEKYYNNKTIDDYFTGKATYYNFNYFLNLSDSVHFYNKDHLNQLGVIVFNKNLFDSILKK